MNPEEVEPITNREVAATAPSGEAATTLATHSALDHLLNQQTPSESPERPTGDERMDVPTAIRAALNARVSSKFDLLQPSVVSATALTEHGQED